MDLSTPALPLPQASRHEAGSPPPAAAGRCLLGLIGSGIQRSLTPALHEAEAAAQGLRLHYQLIDLDHAPGGAADLSALLQSARTMGFAGLNITYPCKQAVIPLLDQLTPEAAAVGAVNTVVFQGGQAVGHNTDASGWAWGFRRSLARADLSRVVLLGAGGAGCAIAHAALGLGVGELRIVDAEPERAAQLAAELNKRHHHGAARPGAGAGLQPPPRPFAHPYRHAEEALQGATGLVHATPTGMDKLPGLPLPAGLLHPGLWVSEIVYFPLETALLRAARAAGCAVSDGGHMAVGQALGAFDLFTGLRADAERMRRTFLSRVQAGGRE